MAAITALIGPHASAQVAVWKADTAGEAIPKETASLDTTGAFVHSFDTAVRPDAANNPLSSGTDFTPAAGHHLVIYSGRFDNASGGRKEVQSFLNYGGTNLAAGWSQGYIRLADGSNECITSGGAIINANGTDVLQLQSIRTDSSGGDPVVRANGLSSIQFIKLQDSLNYLRLSAEGADPNQVLSGADVFEPVLFDTELEDTFTDAGSGTGGFDTTTSKSDILLNDGGHYLVFANTYVSQGGGRNDYTQRLTLDSGGGAVPVTGSQTTVYTRSGDGCDEGAASIGMIIEATAGDILNVELRQEQSRTHEIIGARTSINIVKLPDTVDYVRLQDVGTPSDQDINATGPLAYNDDPGSNLEVDPSFTHSVTTDPSQVTVNADADYLFLAGQYNSDTSQQRSVYNQGWQINGSGGLSDIGQTARYGRAQSDSDSQGNWTGYVTALASGDYIETVTQPLAKLGTENPDNITMQGVVLTTDIRVADLTPPSIAETNPADDAVNVYVDTPQLVATFSESIALTGSGTITITDTGDASSSETINLPSGQVTSSGNQLFITPGVSFELGESYEISISSGALQDTADTPNVYGGTSAGEWNFTIAPADGTAPVITSTDPADDAIGVVPNAILTATFDEEVVIVSGNIRINEVAGGTTLQTIDITNDTLVSVSGNVLTITPASSLPPANELAVQIDAGALNNLAGDSYAGLLNNTDWSFNTASDTTYTGPNQSGGNDGWNDPSFWDIAVPQSGLNAFLPNGASTVAWNGSTPSYTGDLFLGDNSTLQIGWTQSEPNSWNALGTPGQTTITMGAGSLVRIRQGETPSSPASQDIPAIVLTGDATFRLSESTQTPAVVSFSNGVSGSHQFTIESSSQAPGPVTLNAANTVTGLELKAIFGRGNPMNTVVASAAGSLGSGDIFVTSTRSGGETYTLEMDVSGASSVSNTLNIGPGLSAGQGGPQGDGLNILRMDADNTVGFLNVYGFAYAAGTYGRIGTPATVDHEVPWISGDSILTVNSDPGDTIDPTTISFPNDSVNGEVFQSLQSTITYTLTFNEPVSVNSLTTTDITNIAGSPATISVDSVNVLTDTTVAVQVTASTLGDIQLQVENTASIEDLFGNPVVLPQSDTGVVTVRDISTIENQLGILDLSANGGVNPATGNLWQANDTYRLAFITQATTTATDPDITTYNGFVQTVANGSSLGLSSVTWNAIASAAGDGGAIPAVNALTNTGTDPSGGTGEAVFLLDGVDVLANNYADLWDGDAENGGIQINEEGVARTGNSSLPVFGSFGGATWTGTADNGTANSALGNGGNTGFGLISADGGTNWIQRGTDDPAKELPLYALSEPLTVQSAGAGDTTPPTLTSIVDDASGGPVTVGDTVTYTVTFDEAINDTTVTTADFENGSTAGITVDSATVTGDPAVFTVVVTTTSEGSLTLQIPSGAVIEDTSGNALDTAAALPDDTTITVQSLYDAWANGGGGPGQDDNGDGVSNLLAWLLGAADPNANALGLLPDGNENGNGDLVLTFSMLNAASRGDATVTLQWSNDLGITDLWANNEALVPEADGTVNGVTFTVVPNGNLNDVTATIPASAAAGGKLFGRVQAAP